MKNQKHTLKSGLFCLILLLLSNPYFIAAQDASLPFPLNFGASTTFNAGAGNEVTVSHSGASYSSSSYSNCAAGASGNTLRLDNSTDYLDITTPNGTINHIEITIGSNSSTAANAVVAFSADGTTWGSFQELALPANNGTPSCQTHTVTPPAGMKYYRMMRTGFGGYSPVGTVGQTIRTFDINVWANGGAPVPALAVTPSAVSGFTYITGAGPSVFQSFAVSGTNLTAGAAITITAPTNYEVCTTSGGVYGATATITNAAGGTLAATNIYVKLKAGLTVGLYNGQIATVTGGGAATGQNVTLNGSVTSGVLTPLAAPSVAAGASSIGSNMATANWTAVANASGGYIVEVYQGASLIGTFNVAGQATTNTIMTGLSASTAYTYRVTAVGDGLTYSNSPQSAASAVFNTTAAATGGCDIPLYNTEFTDWGTLNVWAGGTTVNDAGGSSVGSSDPFIGTGAGAGFGLSGKPAVAPAAVLGGNTGYIFYGNSTCSAPNYYLTFKPFTFICGGVVQVEVFANTTSARKISIPGATQVSIDAVPADVTRFDRQLVDGVANGISGGTLSTTPMAGSTWTFQAQSTGLFRATFYLPAAVTGSQTLYIGDLSALQSCALTKLKVCTSVCAQKIVASTNYQSCTADGTGLILSGIKGSTTPIPGIVDLKGWNLTGPVTLSVIGPDAAKFSLPVTSIAQATAMAGTSVTVNFTPSVVTGVSNAQLIISSAGAPSYCVSLTGLTATAAGAEITTPVQTWEFATQLIGTTSQSIPISGINLTGPITLTLGGVNAAQFSLSTNSLSIAEATAGTPITVTYLGGISAPLTQNATITLSSPGAPNVVLPLLGLTYSIPPTMYSLVTSVSPAGSGVISQDLGGTEFPAGTTVKLTVLAEPGYKFKNWSDGSLALVRSVVMTSDKSLTAIFEPGTGTTLSPFNAFVPTVIGNTNFTARWGTDTGSTSYTVKVYNSAGTLVYTSPAQGAAVRSFAIPAGTLTAGTLYTYTVTGSTGDVSNSVGPILTTGGTTPACGTVG